MRRIVVAIVLCLLLGLLTSVSLAWCAAMESETPFTVVTKFNDEWVGRIENDVFAIHVLLNRPKRERWTSHEWERADYEPPAPFAELITPPYADEYIGARGLIAGAPFPSLFYIRRLDAPYVFIDEWDYTNHGALRGYSPFEQPDDPAAQARYLPLLPYWPGLLASVGVISAAWFITPLCGLGIRILRAARRRSRKRCTFCNYPLIDETNRCGECGGRRDARQPLVTRQPNALLAAIAFLATAALIGFAVTFHAHDPVEPIIRASYEGDAERVRELLAAGAHPEIVEPVPISGELWSMDLDISPLLAAAASGDVATLHALLEAGADPNVSMNGMPPLSVAADALHFDLCDLLLEYGADPNLKIGRSMSPLDLPAISGNQEAVRFLVSRGADPSRGETAIMSAFVKRDGQMIDLLVELGADLDAATYAAVRYGDEARFEQYLECGADPLRFSDSGATLLFAADSRFINKKIFANLIRCGVDVNARRASGETAIMNAAFDGNQVMVQFLLANGANPNYSDDSGDTALSLALEAVTMNAPGARRCVLYLLMHHADPSVIAEDDLWKLDQHLQESVESVQQSWREFESRRLAR